MPEDSLGAPRVPNRLIHETSPYLVQHAHNPVDWYPWGADALAAARERDVPILLSVGYSACHWCHVMERESFEDSKIAAQMNALFVCVKVDREERPDIDQIYMTAVQVLTGQGGWPMTVFLTPGGEPFYGGTYYPPEDRWGRPGFPRILRAVSEAWAQRRGEVVSQGAEIAAHIRRAGQLELAPAPITPGHLDRARDALRSQFDPKHGGFGGAPKFPQPMVLDFLLRYAVRTGSQDALGMVETTLSAMERGGIRDHLGGGFHRYSTDTYWLVPHFEKMLYDNAQLAQTYLRAYRVTGYARYRAVCEQTLDYVRREMTDPAGGFYSSQDADSEGEEGRFFVWSFAEVQEALGQEDSELFARAYDVTPHGNFEGRCILNEGAGLENLARTLSTDVEDLEARLRDMRDRLFQVRERRARPFRDEKVITAWNGLMLAAFAEAGAVLGRADYVQTAVNNAEFLLQEMTQPGLPLRLLRTGKHVVVPDDLHPRQETRRFRPQPIAGFLEDYALLADGLLRLYEANFDRRWRDAAAAIAETMLAEFDAEEGPFFGSSLRSEELLDRPREATDNAVPSGNSVALEVLARLAVHTGSVRYGERARQGVRQLIEAAAGHPLAFGRLLSAADLALGPIQELAIVGDPADPRTAALLSVARAGYRPNLVVALALPGAPSEDLPLLRGRTQMNGLPAAYVCRNYVCERPVTAPEQLEALLAT